MIVGKLKGGAWERWHWIKRHLSIHPRSVYEAWGLLVNWTTVCGVILQ